MSNYLPDPIGKMTIREHMAGYHWPEGLHRQRRSEWAEDSFRVLSLT